MMVQMIALSTLLSLGHSLKPVFMLYFESLIFASCLQLCITVNHFYLLRYFEQCVVDDIYSPGFYLF